MTTTPARYRLRFDLDLLVRLHEEGVPVRQIAERLGITTTTARRWVTRMGLREPSPAPRPVTEELLERAAELLDEGCSQKETAETLGITKQTVARYFPGRGWTREQIISHSITVRQANRSMRRRGIAA